MALIKNVSFTYDKVFSALLLKNTVTSWCISKTSEHEQAIPQSQVTTNPLHQEKEKLKHTYKTVIAQSATWP